MNPGRQKAVRTFHRGHSPLAGLDYDRWTQRFREALSSQSEEIYLAEQKGEILGYLIVGRCRDTDIQQEVTGEILGIYLSPEHWRKGVGRLLCRQGEHILQSRGYTWAVLWVFERNDQARHFYSAMGFEPDGASKTLKPGVNLKAVRYCKKLENTEQRPAAERRSAPAGKP